MCLMGKITLHLLCRLIHWLCSHKPPPLLLPSPQFSHSSSRPVPFFFLAKVFSVTLYFVSHAAHGDNAVNGTVSSVLFIKQWGLISNFLPRISLLFGAQVCKDHKIALLEWTPPRTGSLVCGVHYKPDFCFRVIFCCCYFLFFFFLMNVFFLGDCWCCMTGKLALWFMWLVTMWHL